MNLRKVIFVAGPITRGHLASNVSKAHEAAVALTQAGFAAIVPHDCCFWHDNLDWLSGGFVPAALHSSIEYETWIEASTSLMARADAVLRLPGESHGADRETDFARSLGIPVFDDIDNLVAHFGDEK